MGVAPESPFESKSRVETQIEAYGFILDLEVHQVKVFAHQLGSASSQ